MLTTSATQLRNSRVADRSSSVAGCTIPAPSGNGGARCTVTHSLGRGSGLEGVAQLVSRHKLAHRAALGIDMDGSLYDRFDALGGQAGARDPLEATVGGGLGVVAGLNPPDLGGAGLGLQHGGLKLQSVDAPGLDAGEDKRRRQGREKQPDHDPSSKCGPSMKSGPGWRAV